MNDISEEKVDNKKKLNKHGKIAKIITIIFAVLLLVMLVGNGFLLLISMTKTLM